MIKPRCLMYNLPMFLSADNKLKPCCFLNTTEQWKEFILWAKDRGFDAEYDLDVTKHNVDNIIDSPTWKALIKSFKTGDTPSECWNSCGPDSYTSTSNTAKHSDYKEE
jgi:hypothetical protein